MRADITIGTSDFRVEASDPVTPDDLEREFSASGWQLPPLGDAASFRLRSGARLGSAVDPGPPAMPHLLVAGGADAGTCLHLQPGLTTIGRGADCVHRLTDPELSRTHFAVDVKARHVTVRAVGATQPSMLNDEPVSGEVTLRPGDRLRAGTTVLEWPGRAAAGVAVTPRRFDLPPSPASPRSPAAALAALIPVAVTGVAVAVIGSSPMMLMALATSVAMGAALVLGRGPRGGRRARRAFRTRRAEFDTEVTEACQDESRARRGSHPGPGVGELSARGPSGSALVRVGLGCADAAVAIADEAGRVTHPQLHDVPVCIELAAPGLALCAPARIARGQARWLLLQLASTHPVQDLRIDLTLDDGSEAEWQWARWLPHLGSVQVGGVERLGPAGTACRSAAVTVVMHDSREAAEAHPDAVMITVGAAALPMRALSADDTGIRQILVQPGTTTAFDADAVPLDFAESAARRLAHVASIDGDDSPTRHLLDLLDLPAIPAPADLVGRWERQAGDVVTPLGVGAGGTVFFDLDKDGPHALIGGTTGSGKSQLLQTVVLGLALQYPPEVAQFLLVDYKGGAAFGACSALPHTAGVLTDLDTRVTGRALRSLSAELRRRERLLAAAGVAGIREYSDASAPMPRLVVVVDEFATLAAELPDFVTGLVGIAQRGRSLGMHLILATQRPGGSVSPDIRANSNLRVALRTITASESADLVDTPDAAQLDPRRPGQAIRADAPAQVFQVANFGSQGPQSGLRVTPLDGWRQPLAVPAATDDVLELDELVDLVVDAAARWPGASPPAPWLEPLPETINDLPAAGRRVPLGLLDLPDEQRREAAYLDLGLGGVTVIAGGSRSGRTSTLLAVAHAAAARYDPSELHIHALDYAGGGLGGLAALPHLGTLTSAAQSPAVSAALIANLAAGQRRRTEHATLLLVDGWHGLCHALDTHDLGSSTTRLSELLAHAAGAQLTAVICGDRTVLAAKLAAVTHERFVLRCNDPADYSLAGISRRDVPSHLPAGRALRARDSAEIQFVSDPGAPSVIAAPDPRAIRVRELPDRLDAASMPSCTDHASLGLGGDRAEPVWLHVGRPAQLLVAGPARSGKTTLLCTLLSQLEARPVAVAAQPGSALHLLALERGHDVLDPARAEVPGDAWLLIDDADQLTDSPLDLALSTCARSGETSMIVTAANDRVGGAFRGLAAAAKRWRRGILLQPGLADGELLGVRLDRTDLGGGPGRGVAVPDPSWGWPVTALRRDRTPIQTWGPRAL